MTRELTELARRIQNAIWNAPGSDKTWVLSTLRQYQRFQEEIRDARRVGPRR